jgi:hypothetical protein
MVELQTRMHQTMIDKHAPELSPDRSKDYVCPNWQHNNKGAENNMCYRDRGETINSAFQTTHSNKYESTHTHDV